MTIEQAQNILDELGIPAHVISWDPQQGLVMYPEIDRFTYAVKQTIFKHLAQRGIRNEER